MKNLYELNKEIEAVALEIDARAAENEGEIPTALDLYLNELTAERKEKLLSIGLWVKNLRAEIDMVQGEEERLYKRRKRAEALVERLKQYLSNNLSSGEVIKGDLVTLAWRASESTEVDAESVPDQFVRYERKILVEEIKRDLKSGSTYSFARLVKKQNLQIR